MHKGKKAVKINKLQQLTSKFESIRMFDDEYFDELYAKLNDIVNSTYNLGEIYDQPKFVMKILRFLIEDFKPKVTIITKSKDVDSIPELSATEIAYLAKNFRNFLRNNNRRARDKNTVELITFRKNDPTKVNNIDKSREKISQSSNNFMGPQCFGC